MGALKRFTPRRPAVAGMFYTASRRDLELEIRDFFDRRSASPVPGTVIGLVAPHAGYMYSGHVAAEGFAQVMGKPYDTVVVIGPSHRDFFQGASVYFGDYVTPIGVVELDEAVAEQLLDAPGTRATDLGHREEHAIEVELPFLQMALGSFKLVPVTMGTQDWATCESVGTRLGEVLKGRKALIVASSDLSHYHSDEEARRLDRHVIDRVETLADRQLYEEVSRHVCEACGAGPVVATMIASKQLGASRASVVSYHTSGEINRDYDEVVGYLAGVLYREEAA
jgi:hypothetical protein